jgi:WD40 repeat protein
VRSFFLALFSLVLANTAAASAQEPAVPGIRTKQKLTILSANDGYIHRRPNPDAKDKKAITQDSITVIQLGPDHPPIVKTVYGTVPNSIVGAPYMAMTGDGHYGFVTCQSSANDPKSPDLLSVIDLADPDLKVVQTTKITNPKMALMHPDGRRLLVPYVTGIQVFEMRDGRLELVKDNPTTDLRLGSIAITPKGDRIASQGRKKDGKTAVHIFSYRDGVIEHQGEVKIKDGLPDWDGPFAFRFTPDGRRLVIPNGSGTPSKGSLDPVFIADMTLNPPTVTEVIPQVADGMESVAIHPSGKFAVLSCLDDTPRAAIHQANSHLAVVDLTSKPARLLYHLPVESLPEGIEFTPDGTQLFVQLTYAHRIAVFDVDGMMLKRSPFVLRVGHGPSSMAIGPRFGK